MKLVKTLLIGGLVIFGLVANGPLMADRGGHGGVGVGLAIGLGLGLGLGYPGYGADYYSPRYYPDPYYSPPSYYYSPPAVTYYAPPPVYVVQGGNSPQAAPEPASWYYCASAKAYYPYVNQCAEGWQRVSPLPPPSLPR
ncbi:MAG: hypothetical protein KGZ83_21075 [Sulfuricella sp.]|nr:hypothetical protein [Sulfuricella sp.]